jgi:hypothetical protein
VCRVKGLDIHTQKCSCRPSHYLLAHLDALVFRLGLEEHLYSHTTHNTHQGNHRPTRGRFVTKSQRGQTAAVSLILHQPRVGLSGAGEVRRLPGPRRGRACMLQRVGTAANLFEDHPEEKLLGYLLLVPEAVASFLGGERHPWPRCEVKKRRLPRTRVLFVVSRISF